MNERRLRDVVAGAVMESLRSDKGLSVESILNCDWDQVEECIGNLQGLSFRESGDFEMFLGKKDELLGYLKVSLFENYGILELTS